MNSLNDVVVNHMHQPWRTFAALINKISTEEPIGKSKRVKRPTKKSIEASARGVVIRETTEMSLTKKKEKVDVTRGKGIELLSQVALTKEAQFEEVRKKSIRDIHKTRPSRSGVVTKTAPSVAKIKPSVTSEGTSVKPGVSDVAEEESSENNEKESDSKHETDESESGSESNHEENEEDEDDKDETKITDKADGDEDERRIILPSTMIKGMKIQRSYKSRRCSYIPHADAKIVSPMDVHVHHEAAATLIEFEFNKILIDKMDKSESYLAAPEHRECYEGLIKSYELDTTIFSTYGKVYSLKRSQKDKDKDEDPFARSDGGLKKMNTNKDVGPTKGPKAKESQSGLSKDDKSLSKSFGKSVQSEEPEFEVAESDMPQDQEKNLGNDDEEPKEKGQNQSWLITLASSAKKPSKTFDELMSTPIDFFAFIMNGLNINNLTQETLLGPVFRHLKGTRSSYAELEYDFEECYKALSEKLD
nr:hypothetical protein [Tanacetum cinerariifolium]